MDLIYQSTHRGNKIEDSNALHTSKVRSNSYFVVYFVLYLFKSRFRRGRRSTMYEIVPLFFSPLVRSQPKVSKESRGTDYVVYIYSV